MPADRTRASKRKVEEGAELTWTTPIDPSKPQSIAFAPNITPGTFNDPPSPIEPMSDSMLFPPSPDSPSGRRQAHSRKKPENHIPRPPNAFILFRSSFIKNQHVSSEVETNHSTLSKIIGLTWQNLPHEERQIWHAKAKIALEEHKRKFPEYAFRPLHTKGKGGGGGGGARRKVREVSPKDMKRCARIAQLLVDGKKGSELEEAIAEFDRHHVPEIVTRFEAPITARSYRRSSSAPVPDTEHSKPTFLKKTPGSSKPRASSTEPNSPSEEAYSDSDYQSPSQGDSEADSEYQSDSLSSPVATSPTITLPEPHPSFEFDTFSWNQAPTPVSPLESYDPLYNGSQESVYDAFTQDSTPCTPQGDMFHPSSLTIDTSFLHTISPAVSPSPMSGMPATPPAYHGIHNHCAPVMNPIGNGMPTADHYDPSFDFFTDMPNYSADVAHLSMASIQMQYPAPDYSMGIKADYSSYYDKSALAPMNNGLLPPHSYPTAIPSYGM
ncbi:hypothetical protein K474DRAFT_1668197 [Panus rudis PR-1116 ss-1]|nr:hypothetical protein K474DRAFT_1668197 [Panus rudis PR-1116 ss-1]